MYTFLTQYNSPNYTPASEAQATWGRPRTIEKIAIHHWGATNLTFEGVVGGFTRPGGLSAHFVATGTGRRVACLVDVADASWATNSANPYTISIECDPRARDEDYDVVGELVAELRATYGNLPLVPHNQFSNTACPGVWSLDRINQVAATKIAKASDQFGLAVTKTVAPVITREEIAKLYLDILERPYDEGGMQTYLKSGMNAGGVRNALLGSDEYKTLQTLKAVRQQEADRKAQEEAAAKAAADAAAQEAVKGSYTQADRDRDNKLFELVQWLVDKIKSIFK